MSHYLIQQIEEHRKITVRTCTEVVGVAGEDHLGSITVRDRATGAEETIAAQYLFLFIGAAPRTDWLDGFLVRDEHGFVVTGPDLVVDGKGPAGWDRDRLPHHLETSVPGVFACGDVMDKVYRQAVTAAGTGCMAALDAEKFLAEAEFELAEAAE